MALIDCKECGNQVSDQAASCPRCGAPLAQSAPREIRPQVAAVERTVGFWLGLGVLLFPLVFAWFLLRKGHTSQARWIGFVWLIVVLFFAARQDDSSPSPRGSSVAPSPAATVVSPPAQPLREYSAQQMAAEYERNTVAADQLFKGKRFKVSGVVDSINTDLFGNPYVTLKGGVNQFMEPQFELDKAHQSFAASLQQGQRISLICTGRGDVAKTPMSEECVPAK